MTLGQVLQGSWPFMAALVIVPSTSPEVGLSAAGTGSTTDGSRTATPAASAVPGTESADAGTNSKDKDNGSDAADASDVADGDSDTEEDATPTSENETALTPTPPPQSYSVSLDLNSTLLTNPVIRYLFSRVFDRFPEAAPAPATTPAPSGTTVSVDEILADRPSLYETLDNLAEATRTLFVDPGSPSRAKLASDMVEDQLMDEFYEPPTFIPDTFALSASPASDPSVTSSDMYSDSYEDEPPIDAASAEFMSELFFCVALWYLNGSFGREVDYALAVKWMAEGVRKFGLVKPDGAEWGWRGDEGGSTS
jgi:hypothetical protein